MAITKKLLEIQKLLKTYTKDWKANYGKYITLDNLLSDLLPICNEFDVLITHQMASSHVVTSVIDTSDDTKIESAFPVSATAPQQIGWAITYGKRYNLGQIFNIATDEDNDWKVKEKTTKKYTKAQVEKLATWSKNVTKWELMQKLAEIKKTYDTSDVDLLLIELTNG